MKIGKTHDGEDFDVDLKRLVSERTFISSVTRYGKSYTLRKFCELLFGKVGIVILDPEGEFASLREKYPFLIVGKDIPLEVETAEFIAEMVLKENLSVILDFSETDIIDTQNFTSLFVEKFMEIETKAKKSYLFIIEEADEFVPEKGTFKSNSLRSIINLCKKGGKRGIGVVLASQRPAFVSKFALSQCTNKIVGRTEWTGDLKVIKDYLRITNEVVDKLPKLDPGEFYFSGNFVSSPQFVRIDEVETTHLGETPDILPQTPKEIQAIVSNLKAQLPKIVEEKLKPTVVDTKAVESKVRKKMEEEYNKRTRKLEKEIKILKATEISDEEIEKKVNKKIDEYKGKYQEQEIKIKNLERFIHSVVSKGQQLVEGNEKETTSSEPIHIVKSKELWLQKLRGSPKKIYEELLGHPYGTLFTKVQLGIMTGYSYKSSNFKNGVSRLNTLGLIKKEGDKIGLK